MGIPPTGGFNGGGGTEGGGDLPIPPPEHICTVYCKQAHYVPVYGGGTEDRVNGAQEMVGAGQVWCGGDAEGCSGGGTDGRGRRRRTGRRQTKSAVE